MCAQKVKQTEQGECYQPRVNLKPREKLFTKFREIPQNIDDETFRL